MERNQDLRIRCIEMLRTPSELEKELPIPEGTEKRIAGYRKTVSDIIHGKDERKLAIIGPCSIHDPKAGIEYAEKLKKLADDVSDIFFVVMRTYFEKPRTALGWKGLITDPDMDESCDIQKGLYIARRLLMDISAIGLPVGCEVLDPIVPQYIDELMSWSSIGARTTESQTHRSLASGLSVPVGFKNSTSGDLSAAVNAAKSASQGASFIGVQRDGRLGVFRSMGNIAPHLILRGGDHGPNYYEDDVEDAAEAMKKAGLEPAIIIDCSHQNSRKDWTRQKRVLRAVVDQIRWGETEIKGFMLESNLFEGSQKIPSDLSLLKYGVSVTDGCIGWEETERIVNNAADILRDAKKKGGRLEML